MMSWDYSSVVENTPSAPVVEPAAASPAPAQAAQSAVLTPEEIDQIRNAPPETQMQISALMQQDLPQDQLVAQVREAMGWSAPTGYDAMVASPTSQELANDVGIAQNAQAMGFSSFTQQDMDLKMAQVETLTKQMLASGASADDIKAAATQFAGPEFASAAEAVAQQQIDAQKFNIFAGPSEPAATQTQPLTLGSVLSGFDEPAPLAPAAQTAPLSMGADAPVDRPYGLATAPMPVVDMGNTTAALAAVGSFVPQPDLPNLVAGRGQGQGNGVA